MSALAAWLRPRRAARKLAEQDESIRFLIHTIAAIADGYEAAPVRQRHLHLVR